MQRRSWAPRFESEVVFRDPDMAQRFRAYAPHPEAARAILESPENRDALLDLDEVDILIDGEPAKLGNRAQFTVAECPVDLLASAHGF